MRRIRTRRQGSDAWAGPVDVNADMSVRHGAVGWSDRDIKELARPFGSVSSGARAILLAGGPASCDGCASAYSATIERGGCPPLRVAFRHSRHRRLAVPLRAAAALWVGWAEPWSSDRCLEPPDRTPSLALAGCRRSEPPGSRAISPSRTPGRLHVDFGWRHPRPVAANDAGSVSGSFIPPGIAAEVQIFRRLPTALKSR
jgi:hypothetical protein